MSRQTSSMSLLWKRPEGMGYEAVRKLIEAGVQDGLNAIGLTTSNHIKASIQRGPKTGFVYYRMQEGEHTTVRKGAADGPVVAVFKSGSGPTGISPSHQSSSPSEYPATDTGRLVSSIGYEVNVTSPARPEVTIFANAEYAIPLELKPSSKGGRPFMSRGVREKVDTFGRILDAAITAKVRGGFNGPWKG